MLQGLPQLYKGSEHTSAAYAATSFSTILRPRYPGILRIRRQAFSQSHNYIRLAAAGLGEVFVASSSWFTVGVTELCYGGRKTICNTHSSMNNATPLANWNLDVHVLGFLIFSRSFLGLPSGGTIWSQGADTQQFEPDGRKQRRASGQLTGALIHLQAGTHMPAVSLLQQRRFSQTSGMFCVRPEN
jgi:hypothetical protein